MVFDVIVAGAGPSGSTAARECALRGLTVLMVDRAEFPRDKPCGGGVNMRAAHLVPFDLTPVVERTIYGLRVCVKQGESYLRRSEEPLTYMTQRRHLDAYLVEHAVKSGAAFREGTAIRAVDRDAGQVVVRAGGESFVGRTLVIADGANGRTAKLAGVEVQRDMGIAYEGNITPRDSYPEEWCDTLGVEVGTCPGGYGWLFPKGDHVNIGVGGHWSIGVSVRERLNALTRYYGFDPGQYWGMHGHPLPLRRVGSKVQEGNVLLVGDAAGFVDVLTGEGIFAAIRSGQAAARHLERYLSGDESDLSGYQREIGEALDADLLISRQLHAIFHLSPRIAATLVRRSSRMWRLVCALLVGQVAYADLKQHSWWLTSLIEGGSSAADLVSRLRTSGS